MLQHSGLQNQVVIITGGSRGIGKEMVRQFAKEGSIVHFCYQQNHDAAELLLQEAKEYNWHVHSHQVDVRNASDCQQLISHIFDKEQKIDVLINNSGIVRDNLLVGLEQKDIKDVLDTNLLGIFYITQAVSSVMMSQRRGSIINISSVAATKGGRGQSNYAASKGAINAFTKAMAVELAPRKIRVNAIAPGVIETDISKEVREIGGEEVLSKILLKRYGKPEEIAYLAVFLASKYAEYITGEVFHVDGGFKMN